LEGLKSVLYNLGGNGILVYMGLPARDIALEKITRTNQVSGMARYISDREERISDGNVYVAVCIAGIALAIALPVGVFMGAGEGRVEKGEENGAGPQAKPQESGETRAAGETEGIAGQDGTKTRNADAPGKEGPGDQQAGRKGGGKSRKDELGILAAPYCSSCVTRREEGVDSRGEKYRPTGCGLESVLVSGNKGTVTYRLPTDSRRLRMVERTFSYQYGCQGGRCGEDERPTWQQVGSREREFLRFGDRGEGKRMRKRPNPLNNNGTQRPRKLPRAANY
jgi:hypothetical protein